MRILGAIGTSPKGEGEKQNISTFGKQEMGLQLHELNPKVKKKPLKESGGF